MKQLYQFLREYFAFSNTEMRGMLLLMAFTLLLLLAPLIYKPLLQKNYQALPADRLLLDSLVGLIEAQTTTPRLKEVSSTPLFPFDPNLSAAAELASLGIPETYVHRIIRYREGGGVFRAKTDLLKIYGFPEETYRQLEAYISIAETRQSQAVQPVVKAGLQPFDLNLADTAQLKKIKGIGNILSERIIKFREALGGFYSMSQLDEIYGISPEALQQLRKYTFVDEGHTLKKINLNLADFKEINKHPYISFDLTKAIVNHRKVYGPFSSLQDLKEIPEVNEELLVKLTPYISI